MPLYNSTWERRVMLDHELMRQALDSKRNLVDIEAICVILGNTKAQVVATLKSKRYSVRGYKTDNSSYNWHAWVSCSEELKEIFGRTAVFQITTYLRKAAEYHDYSYCSLNEVRSPYNGLPHLSVKCHKAPRITLNEVKSFLTVTG